MRLKIHEFELPLRHAFTTARDTRTSQKTLIVELSQDGHSGFGEAPENKYYGQPIETIRTALQNIQPWLETQTLDEPAPFWTDAAPHLADSVFAQCALDEAAHDLWGKLHAKPVHAMWGLDVTDVIPSDYTIGIDTIDNMVAKLDEFPGWPVYKIKLGTEHDIDIIRALRDHTDAIFRVDANTGWTADQTIENSHALKELNVEFIEQPLKPEQNADMPRVRENSALPVIADESCVVEADVDRCAAGFHGVNIKLVKCGGLTPARRMIDRARQLGLQTMVGCMTESTVGISAIAQLLPLLDYVDMDGAVLLGADTASGVKLDRGRVIYPGTPGCGVSLLA
jgi:L-alanine-DL-glutamate epimerase-like enolase superfamily enzyme